MPRKLREVRAELRRAGFVLIRQVGSHQTWQHPSGATLTLAGQDGDDARRYQERDVAQARAAVARPEDGEESSR